MSFKAEALNYDPYRNFKFQIKFEGETVAGVSKISALSKAIEAIDWRTGGDANSGFKLPGRTSYDPITVERGLSADEGFVTWMSQVNTWKSGGGQDGESVAKFRKNLTIEVYNLSNKMVVQVEVKQAWPSKLTCLPELDASGSAVAIETLEIQHEGWEIKSRTASAQER